MDKPINTNSLLDTINQWRTHLLPVWATEKKIERYANGGPPPTDSEGCEDDVIPLGFAQTFMRKELNVLIDPLLLEPGIIDAKLVTPALPDPKRTFTVQSYVNKVLNEVTGSRLTGTLTNVAGRATITGRACVYRKSPNDWVFKCGRLIHPHDATADLLDSSFREWAFAEPLTLRDLEGRLKKASPNKFGWQKDGLECLKLWIMASEAQKYAKGNPRGPGKWAEYYDPDQWLQTEVSDIAYAKPIDVFWYFRKNGKITKDDPRYGGHEKIDLYCISRFGSQTSIKSDLRNNTNYKWMENSTDNAAKEWLEKETKTYGVREIDVENERLLFYAPDIFDSIEQCLIMHVDDASISGEQNLDEVRGNGVTAMPKLAVMEGLLTAVIEGLTFGAQPSWSVRPGVPAEYLRQLERGGIRSNQAFPEGINPMPKNNSFTGFGPASNFIRMLDSGIAADSAAASQGTFGGNQADFAAQASADIASAQGTKSSRIERWLKFLSRVCEQVSFTLCRPWEEHKPEHPSYHDAQRLGMVLQSRYKIQPDEWDSDRWDYGARRLAGAMMRQQAVQVNTQMLQIIGPHMPSVIPFFAREILRGTFGDTVTDQITNPSQEEISSQSENAYRNVTIAFVTGKPPQPHPMDDPIEHSRVASEVAEGRLKAAHAAGQVSQQEVIGVVSILGYAGAHIMRLPQQLSQPAMQRIGEMSKDIQSLPVFKPQTEGEMTQKEQADVQIKSQNQQRLNRQLDEQAKDKEFKRLATLKQLGMKQTSQGEQGKMLAVKRAQAYQDMAMNDAPENSVQSMLQAENPEPMTQSAMPMDSEVQRRVDETSARYGL